MKYRIAVNATINNKQIYSTGLGIKAYGVAVFINKDGSKFCLIKWEN